MKVRVSGDYRRLPRTTPLSHAIQQNFKKLAYCSCLTLKRSKRITAVCLSALISYDKWLDELHGGHVCRVGFLRREW